MDAPSEDPEIVRSNWLAANERASDLAAQLFQPGTGYGDPDARDQDVHKLETAKFEANRLFHEYDELERRNTGRQLLEIQRSQQRATWASFATAAVVGAATIIGLVVAMLK